MDEGKAGLVTMSLAHHTESGEPSLLNDNQSDDQGLVKSEQKLGVGSAQDRPAPRDVSMTLHHIATATLCLQVTCTLSLTMS